MPKSGGGYCNTLISLVFIPNNFKDKLYNIKEKYKNLKYKREITYIILGLFVISLFRIISATHAFYNYEMEPVPIFTSKVGNFAKQNSKPVLEALQSTTSEEYLKTVADDDELLRYVGTYEDVENGLLNNFICFGTDDKDKCTSEPETYMYRIMGITTENVNKDLGLSKDQLKIIKATPSSTSQSWASSNYYNYDWDNSNVTARTYLNGEFINSIKGTVGTHNWSDLITSEKWYKGDNPDETSRKTEVKTLTSGKYKIGLMYVSDYYNSWTYPSYPYNTNSWLHITHGLNSSSTYSNTDEWTMTRYGDYDGEYYVGWWVSTDGGMWYGKSVEETLAVRPVFYLAQSIELSGKGTEENPFTIVLEQPKPALDKLKETGGEVFAGGGEHTTAVEGLYRYKGTYEEVDNNYICLGDENPDKCKTNPDNMYRIIGVTDGTEANETDSLGLEAGMLKVIKATPPSDGTSIKWASSDSNYDWDNSNTVSNTYLNGTFYTGSTIDARIKPYIAEVNWWKGDHTGDYTNPPTSETKTKATSQYRIGLMYASDYYNSWTYSSSGNTNSWINICHGLSSESPTCGSTYEWTMTKYGYSGRYAAWYVRTGGYLDFREVYWSTPAVRPVFYLKSNVKLFGSGTESNPFTIYDEPKQPLEALQSTTSEEYLKTVVDNDELIRYVGTYDEVKNNYICFGTKEKDTCTSEPDTYMYRIIGVTSDNVNTELGLEPNQLKIIKATPVKESSSVKDIAWSSNDSLDIDWDNASNTVRPYLNSNFLNTIDEQWKGIISNPKWYIGDDTQPTTTTGITNEKKKQTTGNYQVGLMYASDYYNSWTYATSKDSWLHITHGTSSSTTYSSYNEWTMTRYGKSGTIRAAWRVYTFGNLRTDAVSVSIAVRPVFYLSSNITLTGSGTESNPFIVSV